MALFYFFFLFFIDIATSQTCDEGEEWKNGKCVTCASGKYQDQSTSAASCKFCLAGSAFATTETACATCIGSTYQAQNSSPSVTCSSWSTCTAGKKGTTPTTSVDRVCSSCGSGTYQTSNMYTGTTCKFCSAGLAFSTTSTACSACTGGTYQNQNSASSVICLTCAAGQFSSTKENSCTNCAAGKFQELPAAIEYQCKFCAAGKSFDSMTTACKDCDPGKYQAENARATVQCKYCPKGFEFASTSADCTKCGFLHYQIHHELYAFAKCCSAYTTTQSKDQPKCKSIEVTSVVSRQAASDGVSVGLPLPPEGALPVFALESYRGTNILDVKFTAKNFEHLSSESDVAELWVWVTSTSLSGSVEPMFAPTSVVLPFDQATMNGEISIPVPWASDTSTTFAVLDGVGGSLTKNNLVCSNIIDRDTVVYVTDKKEMVWNAPEAIYRVGNTDKHTDNTRVQSNEYPMKYLANDIPTLPSSYVHVRPRVIYESTPGKKIFLNHFFFVSNF